jgi:hypothetical protein
MPWSNHAHERVTAFYSEALKGIEKKKLDNPHLFIQQMLIHGEMLKRDFTKRQMNIICAILTLSYLLGKETAIVPKMRDWEIVGISKVKIRQELTQLVKMDVLHWEEEGNVFRIKDIREWKAKYHNGYNDERANELFALNIKDSGIDI